MTGDGHPRRPGVSEEGPRAASDNTSTCNPKVTRLADWVIEALLHGGIDYRANRHRHGVWHFQCTVCGDPWRSGLLVDDDETGSSIGCIHGCDIAEIVADLAFIHAEAAADRVRREPPRRARVIPTTGPADDSRMEALRAVPASEWLPVITGAEIRGRMARCPLPGHDDRSPSMTVYERDVWCFGCQRGGDIFSVAGHMHGIEPRGRAFLDIKRIVSLALFGTAEAA